jgi:hypothetical protein
MTLRGLKPEIEQFACAFPFEGTAFYPIPGIASMHALVPSAGKTARGTDDETLRTKPRPLINRLPVPSIAWHCAMEAWHKTAHRGKA